MERSATALSHRYVVADIVTGGPVLAVVTSLPKAVSAVYLARRGRGSAVLSTALNSNAIEVRDFLALPAESGAAYFCAVHGDGQMQIVLICTFAQAAANRVVEVAA